MDPLTARSFLDLITALVKDRCSPSDDPTEILRATLDLCRSAVSLLEQDLESREPPAKRRRKTTPAAAAAATAGSSSVSMSVSSCLSAPAPVPAAVSGPSTQCQCLTTPMVRESEVAEFFECLKQGRRRAFHGLPEEHYAERMRAWQSRGVPLVAD